MRDSKVEKLVKLALLAAVALILVYFIHFPIFPAAAFLEYDMADVPIIIGTFMFGPGAGLMLTAVVSVLQWLLVSQQSGWVGAVMHLCATGGYVLVAGLVYERNRTLKGAVLAMVLGSLTQVLLMVPLNLIFTVHFYGIPLKAVQELMLPAILPFNAVKVTANSLLTFFLYKRVAHLLGLIGHGREGSSQAKE